MQDTFKSAYPTDIVFLSFLVFFAKHEQNKNAIKHKCKPRKKRHELNNCRKKGKQFVVNYLVYLVVSSSTIIIIIVVVSADVVEVDDFVIFDNDNNNNDHHYRLCVIFKNISHLIVIYSNYKILIRLSAGRTDTEKKHRLDDD